MLIANGKLYMLSPKRLFIVYFINVVDTLNFVNKGLIKLNFFVS